MPFNLFLELYFLHRGGKISCVKTQILKEIFLAVDSLKRGIPIAFPTETVYGLGAPLFQEEAVSKVFRIKGRPQDNPLIAHIAELEEVERLAEEIPGSFFVLAKAFWPGPLTFVLKRRKEVPALVSAGHPTIAIRLPSHPIARELIRQVGEPIVAPSANLSGRPSPTCVKDVLEDLDGKIPYIIDGGPCEVGIESTVLSLVGDRPKILRPGKISAEEIEAVLGKKVDLAQKGDVSLSPGMKYRHYAPKAKVRLVFDPKELQENHLIYPKARSLYADLREADRKGVNAIDIFCDEEVKKDAGLMNRLLRAAGQIG
jgi:L-threonylcarbamoyladenylate synthase